MRLTMAMTNSFEFMMIQCHCKVGARAMALLVFCSLLGWSSAQNPINLRISDIHGQSWNGSLVSIDQESLVYKPADSTGGVESSKKTDEITRLDRSGNNPNRPAESPALKAATTDGSLIAMQRIEGKEKNWSIKFSDQFSQNDFSGELKYLKLKKLDTKAEEAWDAYLREDIKSDALIVVRPGGALDRVDGVVKEIREDKVVFDVDGQIVEASIERLAGILWYRKPQESVPKGFRVQLSNGSSLVAQRASVNQEGLELAGSWGNPIRVPLDWLLAIDCGLDKIAWISSLASLESRSLRAGGLGDFDPILAKTFKPRWIKSDGSGQDLLFPGPGEYTLRAPQGMVKFQARVERANESDVQSPIMVEVWVDDQIAFKQELGSTQEFVEIDVPIAQEKKIKLTMQSKGSLNLGTRALWKQPRFTK